MDIKDEPDENSKKIDAPESSKTADNGEDAPVVDLSEIDLKPDIEKLNGQVKPGWYHLETIKKERKDVSEYKPMSRNPLYAGGEFTSYVELNELKNHYHPSVSLFAYQILNGT